MTTPQPPPRSLRRGWQRGASMVEFVLVALPLLLVGLAIVEIAYSLMTRQVLRLALHEAARAGAVQHGEPQVMAAALTTALVPLFVPAGRYGSPQARLQASQAYSQRTAGLALWRLDILGPPPAAYQDFGRPHPQYGGRWAIAHDYLAEQHARARRHWPDGVGPASGLTIVQANILHLRLRYLRKPLTPLTATLLKAASWAASEPTRVALAAGLLPLTVTERMIMQSDPIAWPSNTISAGQQE